MVLAPGLFSMITGRPPSASESLGCTMRACTSVPPPAAKPTTTRTGLPGIGKDCASAVEERQKTLSSETRALIGSSSGTGKYFRLSPAKQYGAALQQRPEFYNVKHASIRNPDPRARRPAAQGAGRPGHARLAALGSRQALRARQGNGAPHHGLLRARAPGAPARRRPALRPGAAAVRAFPCAAGPCRL